MKNKITITRKEFHDTLIKIMGELSSNSLDAIKFAILGTSAEMEFFGDDEEDDDTDTESSFKVGDKVFVIDNEGDGNYFVNRVVIVTKVEDDGCEVTNGKYSQTIYFHNIRKVM